MRDSYLNMPVFIDFYFFSAVIKKTLEEKTKYKEVAPTWELNIETYGYGKQRKVYDPDYEHVESSKFREYERLEGEGYDDDIKDPDSHKVRNDIFSTFCKYLGKVVWRKSVFVDIL